MPADPVAGRYDAGRVKPTRTEDPAVFIRTGKRYALGYFAVGCCFGIGADFVSGDLRIVLIISAVLFVLIAAWCGFFYGLLGAADKIAEQASSRGDWPEITASKQREMMDHMFPRPTPSLKDRLGRKMEEELLASPASETEALEWARSHQVGFRTGRSRKQSVDLRLSPESLPSIAALLGSSDQELVTTATLALAFNGAHMDSDATPTTDPTVYRVTMPNGVVHTVPVESP